MRFVRLSLVGTVILSLLTASGAVAVVAQSGDGSADGASPAAYVTGTRVFAEFSARPADATDAAEEGYDWQADNVLEMSDPRVAGTLTMQGSHVELHETGSHATRSMQARDPCNWSTTVARGRARDREPHIRRVACTPTAGWWEKGPTMDSPSGPCRAATRRGRPVRSRSKGSSSRRGAVA